MLPNLGAVLTPRFPPVKLRIGTASSDRALSLLHALRIRQEVRHETLASTLGTPLAGCRLARLPDSPTDVRSVTSVPGESSTEPPVRTALRLVKLAS